MGNIFRGNTGFSKIYRGQTELSKVYRGQTEVWSSAIPYPSPVVDSGLVANFNTWDPASYPGSGNTWYNLAGNGDLTQQGGITSLTYDGSIPYFDYSAASSQMHSGNVTGVGGSITYCSWARTPGLDSNGIVGMGTAAFGAQAWMEVMTNGNLKFGLYNFDQANGFVTTGITTGWHFLVTTLDGLTGVQSGYKDGTFIALVDKNRAYSGNSTYRINFGRFTSGVYGNNDVSHILTYDRALSSTEITDLYDQYKSFYGLS